MRAEGAKSRRHKAASRPLPQASAALTAVKPCWAMSPLVVASALPPGRWFDVVIFDEASQVPPAQAISAIARARQVVVAGDEQQLPPTNFFTVASDDADAPATADDTLTDGFESVLDVLSAALPTRDLTWHYRSRDERLIAFSNRQIYDGRLVTFPGTGDRLGRASSSPSTVRPRCRPASTPSRRPTAEVARVVDLVLEHARTRPHRVAGRHRAGHHPRDPARRRAAPRALRSAPRPRGVLRRDRAERFFVKNLERVQGDERDAIILSIGYGKTPHGRVLHRFGPLNIEGGERRLNVAITRARSRMTVVSSLRASDLDPTRLKARGALMLRDFLAYAATAPAGGRGARGATLFANAPRHRRPAAQRPRGPPAPRGPGRARGLRHRGAPHRPRRRGPRPPRTWPARRRDRRAAYAAMSSTRDRDRLRPEQLARLGWLHERVWTTDLFRDPAREIARIVTTVRAIEPATAHSRGGAGSAPDPTRDGDGSEAPDPGADRTGSASGAGRAAAPDSSSDESGDSGAGVTTGADGAVTDTRGATPTATGDQGEGRRKRRRVFRKGTGAAADPSSEAGESGAAARPSRAPGSGAAATSSTSAGASVRAPRDSVTSGCRSSARRTTSEAGMARSSSALSAA